MQRVPGPRLALLIGAVSMNPPERLKALPDARGVAIRARDKSGYTAPGIGFVPGVTTILGATSAGKERLKQWLQRPDAQAISDAAKTRGTWTHEAIETWIDAHTAGSPPPDPKHFAFGGYWRNMRPWLEQHWDQAVALERSVYHPSGFAGSFDALGYANYGNEPEALTLFDWKTSKRRRDVDLVEDYFCQLGAYAKALNYVYGVRPERALLVIARPMGTTPDIWELDSDELCAATNRFEKRLQRYYTMP